MTDGPRFAHASEAELARILDYYGVSWQYEPRTFPILWNLDGSVVESFSPDFYLPEMDLYVELTTLRQSLVRRKNRKLRRLRELYPDVRAKLFYGKDFRALMLKYGRFDLAASLSGLEGQTMAATLVRARDASIQLTATSKVSTAKPARVPPKTPMSTADGPAPARSGPTDSGTAGDPASPAPDGRRRRPSRGTRRRRGRRSYASGPEAR